MKMLACISWFSNQTHIFCALSGALVGSWWHSAPMRQPITPSNTEVLGGENKNPSPLVHARRFGDPIVNWIHPAKKLGAIRYPGLENWIAQPGGPDNAKRLVPWIAHSDRIKHVGASASDNSNTADSPKNRIEIIDWSGNPIVVHS